MNKNGLVLTLSILYYTQAFLSLILFLEFRANSLPYAVLTNVVLGTVFMLALMKNKYSWKIASTVLLAVGAGLLLLQVFLYLYVLDDSLIKYVNEINSTYPNNTLIESLLNVILSYTLGILHDLVLIAVYIIYLCKIQNFQRFNSAKKIIMGLLIGAGVIRLLLIFIADLGNVDYYLQILLSIATYVIFILVARLDLSGGINYHSELNASQIVAEFNYLDINFEDKLKQLEFLLAKQIISKEEFDEKRKEIIDQI